MNDQYQTRQFFEPTIADLVIKHSYLCVEEGSPWSAPIWIKDGEFWTVKNWTDKDKTKNK